MLRRSARRSVTGQSGTEGASPPPQPPPPAPKRKRSAGTTPVKGNRRKAIESVSIDNQPVDKELESVMEETRNESILPSIDRSVVDERPTTTMDEGSIMMTSSSSTMTVIDNGREENTVVDRRTMDEKSVEMMKEDKTWTPSVAVETPSMMTSSSIDNRDYGRSVTEEGDRNESGKTIDGMDREDGREEERRPLSIDASAENDSMDIDDGGQTSNEGIDDQRFRGGRGRGGPMPPRPPFRGRRGGGGQYWDTGDRRPFRGRGGGHNRNRRYGDMEWNGPPPPFGYGPPPPGPPPMGYPFPRGPGYDDGSGYGGVDGYGRGPYDGYGPPPGYGPGPHMMPHPGMPPFHPGYGPPPPPPPMGVPMPPVPPPMVAAPPPPPPPPPPVDHTAIEEAMKEQMRVKSEEVMKRAKDEIARRIEETAREREAAKDMDVVQEPEKNEDTERESRQRQSKLSAMLKSAIATKAEQRKIPESPTPTITAPTASVPSSSSSTVPTGVPPPSLVYVPSTPSSSSSSSMMTVTSQSATVNTVSTSTTSAYTVTPSSSSSLTISPVKQTSAATQSVFNAAEGGEYGERRQTLSLPTAEDRAEIAIYDDVLNNPAGPTQAMMIQSSLESTRKVPNATVSTPARPPSPQPSQSTVVTRSTPSSTEKRDDRSPVRRNHRRSRSREAKPRSIFGDDHRSRDRNSRSRSRERTDRSRHDSGHSGHHSSSRRRSPNDRSGGVVSSRRRNQQYESYPARTTATTSSSSSSSRRRRSRSHSQSPNRRVDSRTRRSSPDRKRDDRSKKETDTKRDDRRRGDDKKSSGHNEDREDDGMKDKEMRRGHREEEEDMRDDEGKENMSSAQASSSHKNEHHHHSHSSNDVYPSTSTTSEVTDATDVPSTSTGARPVSPPSTSRPSSNEPPTVSSSTVPPSGSPKPEPYETIEESIFHTQIRDMNDYGGPCFCTDGECGVSCLRRYMTVECGKWCPSKEKCTNKAMQKKQCAKVEVFYTNTEKGFGVRACEPIKKGSFIVEYLGEVVSEAEGERRKKKYSKDSSRRHHYLMTVTDSSNRPYIIDATTHGNVSRFLNHSCEPNAICDKWSVRKKYRMGFFAKKNIEVGEEITFDYRFQNYGRTLKECCCGAASCRRFLSTTQEAKEEEERIRNGCGSEDSADDEDEEEEEEVEEAEVEDDEEKMPTERYNEQRTTIEQAEALIEKKIIKSAIHHKKLSSIMFRLTPSHQSLRARLIRLLSDSADVETGALKLFTRYNGRRILQRYLSFEVEDESDVIGLRQLISLIEACLDLLPKFNFVKRNEVQDLMAPLQSMAQPRPVPDVLVVHETLNDILEGIDEDATGDGEDDDWCKRWDCLSTKAAEIVAKWIELPFTFRIPKRKEVAAVTEGSSKERSVAVNGKVSLNSLPYTSTSAIARNVSKSTWGGSSEWTAKKVTNDRWKNNGQQQGGTHPRKRKFDGGSPYNGERSSHFNGRRDDEKRRIDDDGRRKGDGDERQKRFDERGEERRETHSATSSSDSSSQDAMQISPTPMEIEEPTMNGHLDGQQNDRRPIPSGSSSTSSTNHQPNTPNPPPPPTVTIDPTVPPPYTAAVLNPWTQAAAGYGTSGPSTAVPSWPPTWPTMPQYSLYNASSVMFAPSPFMGPPPTASLLEQYVYWQQFGQYGHHMMTEAHKKLIAQQQSDAAAAVAAATVAAAEQQPPPPPKEKVPRQRINDRLSEIGIPIKKSKVVTTPSSSSSSSRRPSSPQFDSKPSTSRASNTTMTSSSTSGPRTPPTTQRPPSRPSDSDIQRAHSVRSKDGRTFVLGTFPKYCRVRTDDGAIYYYNKVTRSPTWNLPEGEEANSEDELNEMRGENESSSANNGSPSGSGRGGQGSRTRPNSGDSPIDEEALLQKKIEFKNNLTDVLRKYIKTNYFTSLELYKTTLRKLSRAQVESEQKRNAHFDYTFTEDIRQRVSATASAYVKKHKLRTISHYPDGIAD